MSRRVKVTSSFDTVLRDEHVIECVTQALTEQFGTCNRYEVAVADVDPPDGWVIEHHRMTDSLRFGPFASIDEAAQFARDNVIGCNVKPMWRSVDWNRR